MPENEQKTIELGTISAKVDDRLVLKVEVCSGSVEIKGKKTKFDVCQSAGGGTFIINFEGKQNVEVLLKDLLSLIINKFDQIPNSKED